MDKGIAVHPNALHVVDVEHVSNRPWSYEEVRYLHALGMEITYRTHTVALEEGWYALKPNSNWEHIKHFAIYVYSGILGKLYGYPVKTDWSLYSWTVSFLRPV